MLRDVRVAEGSAAAVLVATLQSHSDPIFSLDTAYRYTSFNHAHEAVMKAIYGATIEIGTNMLGHMTVPEDSQVAEANLTRALGGEHVQDEAFSGDFDRFRRYFSICHQPIHGPGGDICGVLVTARDITDQRRLQEDLEITHDRLTRLVQSNVIGVVVARADGGIVEANDYYLRLVGYSREELIAGKIDWRALTPPEHLAADALAIQELKATGICSPYEKEYVRRDGTRVGVELADAFLGGSEELIIAIVRDVTPRMAAVRALRDSEERYRLLIENTSLAVLHYDTAGVLLMANSMVARYVASSQEDIIGKHCTAVFGDAHGRTVLARIESAVQSGNSAVYEAEVELPTGKFWVRSHYAAYRNSQGRITGAQAITEDITVSKLAEIERSARAEEAARAKVELEHKNIALVEVLRVAKEESERTAQYISKNIDVTIDPILERLRMQAGPSAQMTISALEESIRGILSPFVQRLSREFALLSSRELEVCELIRKGRDSKQIAATLSISLATVHKFRQRIRSKLGISNADIDLGAYLRSNKLS